jgi:adenosylmethionine-8-amino-7-oxononanoate aminotransferase
MKTTQQLSQPSSSASGGSDARQRTNALIDADRRVLWHPFTQTSEWLGYNPLVIEKADGFHLIDSDGNRYLDAVSSIWCNVHGHGHPKIVAAMKEQLDRVSHSTMLGLSHEPGIRLAEKLVEATPAPLARVFYSDSGSTAVEAAIRMAFQYWRQVGEPEIHLTH